MRCPKCREGFTQEDVKNYEDNERLRKDFEEIYKSKVTSLNWWKIKTRRLGTTFVLIGCFIVLFFGNKPIKEMTSIENLLLLGPLVTGIFFWVVGFCFRCKYDNLFEKYKVRRGY